MEKEITQTPPASPSATATPLPGHEDEAAALYITIDETSLDNTNIDNLEEVEQAFRTSEEKTNQLGRKLRELQLRTGAVKKIKDGRSLLESPTRPLSSDTPKAREDRESYFKRRRAEAREASDLQGQDNSQEKVMVVKNSELPECVNTILKFDGTRIRDPAYETSIEVFLRHIEAATATSDWTDKHKIKLTIKHIKGAAEERLSSLPYAQTWEIFKEDLLQMFREKPKDVSRALHKLKMKRKKGEFFSRFLVRIQNRLNSYHPEGFMPDEDKSLHIQRILQYNAPERLHVIIQKDLPIEDVVDELQDELEVRKHYKLTIDDIRNELENPTTVKSVADDEKKKSQTANETVAYVNQKRRDDRNEKYNAKKDVRGSNNNNQYAQKKSQGEGYRGQPRNKPTQSGPQCYRCGRFGHIARSCRERCFHCNKTGHYASQCQAKKKSPNQHHAYGMQQPGNEQRSTMNALQSSQGAPPQQYLQGAPPQQYLQGAPLPTPPQAPQALTAPPLLQAQPVDTRWPTRAIAQNPSSYQ